MNPAERRAVAEASSKASAQASTEALRRRISAKIRRGEYVTNAERRQLSEAGLLGTHGVIGETVKNLAESAEYTLPGLYEVGKAGYGDVHDTLSGRPTIKRTTRVGKSIYESTKQTVEHPLRRPGDTLLLGLGLASAGAGLASRASAAATAAREAGAVGKSVTKAALTRAPHEGGSLLRKPAPEIRKVKIGETEFQGTYSKNALRRGGQKALDKRAAKQAARGRPEALNAKAAKFGGRQRMIEEEAARAPEMTVKKAGHKLTPGQQMAVRAVIEQTPLEHRLALAKQELAGAAKPATRKRLAKEIGLLEAAKPYVITGEDGRVSIADFKTPRKGSKRKAASPEELRIQVERIARGGTRRERQGVELGVLDPEQIAARRAQPGEIAREAAGATEGQPALGYLGYGNRRARDVVFRPFASRTGAKPRPTPELAGSLKHSTGTAQRTAAYQHNTSRVAATGMAAMNRLHLSVRNNARLIAAGVKARPVDTLRTKYVPVRDRDLSPGAMQTLRSLQQKVENDEPLTGAERQAFQRAMEEITPHIDAEALDSHVGTEMDGVYWVPKRVFDHITQNGQNASVPIHFSDKFVRTTWTEFNAGLRALVLYSKGLGTAYITPNLGANILLGAFQGGPKWVAAAVKSLNPKFRKAIGEDAMQAALARMGEGFMSSTFAEHAGRGPISALSRQWANGLGKVTDAQTRFASLVYEAGQRGFKTPAQFRALMLDPKHAEDAMDVTIRARDAALDYGLMSPAEKSYIASWLFVYPFIRASTRYALNFPLDHPYQAAVYAQLANIARQNTSLGDRGLSYEAGLVQTGERNIPGAGALPVVANANALSPFSAPVETFQQVGSFFGLPSAAGGHGLIDLASPAVTAALETLTGKDSFTGADVPQNIGGFAGQVANNIPFVQDIRQLKKTPAERARQVSPREPMDVFWRQIFGSLAAHPYNPALAEKYRKPKSKRRKGRSGSADSIYGGSSGSSSNSIYK